MDEGRGLGDDGRRGRRVEGCRGHGGGMGDVSCMRHCVCYLCTTTWLYASLSVRIGVLRGLDKLTVAPFIQLVVD